MRMAPTTLVLALLSAVAPNLPAVAQTGSGPAAPARTATPGPAQAAAAGTATPNDKRAMDRVEQHIKELHSRLAITPAQDAQWNAFAAIMRQNAEAMERSYVERQSHAANLSALDDMRSYAAMSRLHADNVDKLLPAFESLYNSMSPEQRAAADKTFQKFQPGPARPGKA